MMQRGVKSMNFAEIFRCIMQWGDNLRLYFSAARCDSLLHLGNQILPLQHAAENQILLQQNAQCTAT
jgi:hypothetical protein